MRRTTIIGLGALLLSACATAQESPPPPAKPPTVDLDGLREPLERLAAQLGPGSNWPDPVRRTEDGRPVVAVAVTNRTAVPLDLAAITSSVRTRLEQLGVALATEPERDRTLRLDVQLHEVQTTHGPPRLDGWIDLEARGPNSSWSSGSSLSLPLDPGDWSWIGGARLFPAPTPPTWAGRAHEFVDDASLAAQEALPELYFGGTYARELCITADGRRALTSDMYGAGSSLWDLDPATGGVVSRALLHPGGDHGASALAPDGRLAAVFDVEGRALVWTISEDGVREVQRLRVPLGGRGPKAATFARGGRSLLVGGGGPGDAGTILEYSVDPARPAPLEPAAPWPALGGAVYGLVASPDGSRVVSTGGSGADAALWELGGGAPTRSASLGPANAAVFSADGSRLFTGYEDRVQLWAVDGAEPRPLASASIALVDQLEDRGVEEVVLLEGVALAATATRLHAWEVAASGELSGQREIGVSEGRPSGPVELASAGGMLVSAWQGEPWFARVGRDLRFVPLGPLPVEISNSSEGFPLAVAPDGRFVLTGDRDLRVCRTGLAGGLPWWSTAAVIPRRSWVRSLAFASDGERFAVGDATAVEVWRLDGQARPERLQRLEVGASTVSFAPDGRLLLVSGQAIELRPVDGGEPVRIQLPDETWSATASIVLGRYVLAVLRAPGDGASGLRAWSTGGEPVAITATPQLDPQEVLAAQTSNSALVALTLPGGLRLVRLEPRGDALALVPAGEIPTLDSGRGGTAAFVPGGRWLLVPGLEDALDLWWVADAPAGITKAATLRVGGSFRDPTRALLATADGRWLVGRGSWDDARAWRLSGGRDVAIGAEGIRWERPAARPVEAARLEVTSSRVGDVLTVHARNLGAAPAFLARGTASVRGAGLIEDAPVLLGTIPPGGEVKRRVPLGGELQGDPSWTHAWGDPGRVGPLCLAGRSPAELLRIAAQEALRLPESYLWRERLLGGLGLGLVASGEEPAALSVAEAMGSYRGKEVRMAVARRRADRGDLAGAEQALEGMRHDQRWRRAEMRARAGAAAARRTKLDDALGVAARIANPARRATAQVEAGRRLAEAGRERDVDQALAAARASALVVEQAYTEWCEAGLMVASAHEALDRHEDGVAFVDSMRAAARRVNDPWARAFCLRETARAYAGVERLGSAAATFDEARSAAREVPEMNRGNALALIAQAEGEAGMPGALAAAEGARGEGVFAEARSDEARFKIGTAQVERGDVEGALATAASIRDFEQYRLELLTLIARRLARDGKVHAALGAIEAIGQGSARAAAYLDLARAQALAGAKDEARATAERAEFLVAGYAAPRHWEVDEPTRFSFEHPATWIVNYEATGFTSAGTRAMQQEAISTLCASAMRLRLALGWTGGERFARAFDGEDDLASLVAGLHGELGARADAEAWIERLRDPRSRVWAILGLAEGLLRRR